MKFLRRYVKTVIVRDPMIEAPDVYDLAGTVSNNLEKVHPSGKLLQGVCSFQQI